MYSPHQSSSFRIKQNTGMDLSPTKRSSKLGLHIVLIVAGNDRTGGGKSFSIGLIHLGASFNC